MAEVQRESIRNEVLNSLEAQGPHNDDIRSQNELHNAQVFLNRFTQSREEIQGDIDALEDVVKVQKLKITRTLPNTIKATESQIKEKENAIVSNKLRITDLQAKIATLSPEDQAEKAQYEGIVAKYEGFIKTIKADIQVLNQTLVTQNAELVTAIEKLAKTENEIKVLQQSYDSINTHAYNEDTGFFMHRDTAESIALKERREAYEKALKTVAASHNLSVEKVRDIIEIPPEHAENAERLRGLGLTGKESAVLLQQLDALKARGEGLEMDISTLLTDFNSFIDEKLQLPTNSELAPEQLAILQNNVRMYVGNRLKTIPAVIKDMEGDFQGDWENRKWEINSQLQDSLSDIESVINAANVALKMSDPAHRETFESSEFMKTIRARDAKDVSTGNLHADSTMSWKIDNFIPDVINGLTDPNFNATQVLGQDWSYSTTEGGNLSAGIGMLGGHDMFSLNPSELDQVFYTEGNSFGKRMVVEHNGETLYIGGNQQEIDLILKGKLPSDWRKTLNPKEAKPGSDINAERPDVVFLSKEDQRIEAKIWKAYLKAVGVQVVPYAGAIPGFIADVGDVNPFSNQETTMAMLRISGAVPENYRLDKSWLDYAAGVVGLGATAFGAQGASRTLKARRLQRAAKAIERGRALDAADGSVDGLRANNVVEVDFTAPTMPDVELPEVEALPMQVAVGAEDLVSSTRTNPDPVIDIGSVGRAPDTSLLGPGARVGTPALDSGGNFGNNVHAFNPGVGRTPSAITPRPTLHTPTRVSDGSDHLDNATEAMDLATVRVQRTQVEAAARQVEINNNRARFAEQENVLDAEYATAVEKVRAAKKLQVKQTELSKAEMNLTADNARFEAQAAAELKLAAARRAKLLAEQAKQAKAEAAWATEELAYLDQLESARLSRNANALNGMEAFGAPQIDNLDSVIDSAPNVMRLPNTSANTSRLENPVFDALPDADTIKIQKAQAKEAARLAAKRAEVSNNRALHAEQEAVLDAEYAQAADKAAAFHKQQAELAKQGRAETELYAENKIFETAADAERKALANRRAKLSAQQAEIAKQEEALYLENARYVKRMAEEASALRAQKSADTRNVERSQNRVQAVRRIQEAEGAARAEKFAELKAAREADEAEANTYLKFLDGMHAQGLEDVALAAALKRAKALQNSMQNNWNTYEQLLNNRRTQGVAGVERAQQALEAAEESRNALRAEAENYVSGLEARAVKAAEEQAALAARRAKIADNHLINLAKEKALQNRANAEADLMDANRAYETAAHAQRAKAQALQQTINTNQALLGDAFQAFSTAGDNFTTALKDRIKILKQNSAATKALTKIAKKQEAKNKALEAKRLKLELAQSKLAEEQSALFKANEAYIKRVADNAAADSGLIAKAKTYAEELKALEAQRAQIKLQNEEVARIEADMFAIQTQVIEQQQVALRTAREHRVSDLALQAKAIAQAKKLKNITARNAEIATNRADMSRMESGLDVADARRVKAAEELQATIMANRKMLKETTNGLQNIAKRFIERLRDGAENARMRRMANTVTDVDVSNFKAPKLTKEETTSLINASGFTPAQFRTKMNQIPELQRMANEISHTDLARIQIAARRNPEAMAETLTKVATNFGRQIETGGSNVVPFRVPNSTVTAPGRVRLPVMAPIPSIHTSEGVRQISNLPSLERTFDPPASTEGLSAPALVTPEVIAESSTNPPINIPALNPSAALRMAETNVAEEKLAILTKNLTPEVIKSKKAEIAQIFAEYPTRESAYENWSVINLRIAEEVFGIEGLEKGKAAYANNSVSRAFGLKLQEGTLNDIEGILEKLNVNLTAKQKAMLSDGKFGFNSMQVAKLSYAEVSQTMIAKPEFNKQIQTLASTSNHNGITNYLAELSGISPIPKGNLGKIIRKKLGVQLQELAGITPADGILGAGSRRVLKKFDWTKIST